MQLVPDWNAIAEETRTAGCPARTSHSRSKSIQLQLILVISIRSM
jgi:hypothetical protein